MGTRLFATLVFGVVQGTLYLPFLVLHKSGVITATVVLAVVCGLCRGQVDAVSTARHDLELGLTVDGQVSRVLVEPGDRVEEGQLLIELEDLEGQALIEQYRLRANSDLGVRSAQARLDLARVEEEAIRRAFDNQAAQPIEVERARLTTSLAELDLSLARREGLEVRQQLSQARSRHDRYSLKAPIAGVVDRVAVSRGQTVEALAPVLRLVATDPLWVDAAVPTDRTLELNVDDPAWVRVHLPGQEEPVLGRVIHRASVADAASDTRLVRVEVPNPTGLPAGCTVTVWFTEPAALSSTADRDQGQPRGIVSP